FTIQLVRSVADTKTTSTWNVVRCTAVKSDNAWCYWQINRCGQIHHHCSTIISFTLVPIHGMYAVLAISLPLGGAIRPDSLGRSAPESPLLAAEACPSHPGVPHWLTQASPQGMRFFGVYKAATGV